MRNMAYKYRIYPDRDQQVFFRMTFGCCRYVYNRMLCDKKAAYEKDGKILRNQRNDYQHKLSREIAERYDVVAVEDLDMQAMSRGLHFGKSVMDNGFGSFCNKLAYKLEKQGKSLIKVDRFYPSSKRCSSCGQVKKELGLGERVYICACGMRLDRDINAAINIREEGRRLLRA